MPSIRCLVVRYALVLGKPPVIAAEGIVRRAMNHVNWVQVCSSMAYGLAAHMRPYCSVAALMQALRRILIVMSTDTVHQCSQEYPASNQDTNL
jgi:uncharacterized membrane protein